jgi:hypothetical protein
MKKRMLLYVFCGIILFCQSCTHDDFVAPITIEDMEDYSDVEIAINQNIQSIRELVLQQMNGGVLFSIDSTYNNATLLYFLNQDTPITFHKIINRENRKYPYLSIAPEGTDYYWTLSHDFLLDNNGKKIKVSDDTIVPYLQYMEGHWTYIIENTYREISEDQLSNGELTINQVGDNLAVISFPSLYQLTFPMSGIQLPDVPQKAFYKDIFLDAGIGLTSRKSLHAARYLGLSLEGISFPRSGAEEADSLLQNAIIEGDVDDTNGRLLYPDGQPRYRLLFVNGGSSKTHGKSLSEKALLNMRQFINNGGSYVGTCAGAFFASNGYDSHTDYPYYLSAWPSLVNHTGISASSTGMIIEQNSPLLHYFDFGGDYYVSNIRHNKGGYPAYIPEGTEVLARFDYPAKENVHMQPSIWAYKPSISTGRVIMEGSHPEEVSDGERRDLTASMILYALDGIGRTTIKGFLQNGKTRIMNMNSEDGNPLFTKIGDLQIHHFAVNIPEDAHDITVSLNSEKECDFSLMMCHNTFAYPEVAEYTSPNEGAHQHLSFSSLDSGIWFVSVLCKTTVEVTSTEYGQSYLDNNGVLNGIPYQIIISWK